MVIVRWNVVVLSFMTQQWRQRRVDSTFGVIVEDFSRLVSEWRYGLVVVGQLHCYHTSRNASQCTRIRLPPPTDLVDGNHS